MPTKKNDNELRRQELAEAKQAHADANAKLEEAKEARRTVNRRFDEGDTSLSPEEFRTAELDVTYWQGMNDVTGQKVVFAERRVRPEEPILAEVIANAIGANIHGLPSRASDEMPDPASDVPEVVVVQTKPHAEDRSNGSISGDVRIVLCGPEYIVGMDRIKVQDLLAASGIAFGHGDRRADPTRDLALRITSAYIDVPLIDTDVQDWQLSMFAQGLGAGASLNGHNVAIDGEKRTALIDVTLTRRAGSTTDADFELRRATDKLNAYVGRLISGIGVVEAVEITGTDGDRGSDARGQLIHIRKVHARLKVVSQTPGA